MKCNYYVDGMCMYISRNPLPIVYNICQCKEAFVEEETKNCLVRKAIEGIKEKEIELR